MTGIMLDHLGGEDAVHRLVNRFYDLVESRDEAKQLHRLHLRGHGMEHTRAEQVNFMIGFLGGRQHYREKHGHMDVREIHAHIPIRQEDAEVWLETWDMALNDCGHEGPEVERLRSTLRRVASILINDLPDWRKGETY